MAEKAAQLTEHVIPEVPVRQWVLSLPHKIRYRLAYDKDACTIALRAFVNTVFADLRRRAKRHHGIARGKPGGVTFIQRFASSLALNVHFHTILFDGVYTSTATAPPLPGNDSLASALSRESLTFSKEPRAPRTTARRRMTWAELMKRVFSVDVLECPVCRGPMKIIAEITEPKVIKRFLAALDLPTEAPKIERARPPPQVEFGWAEDFGQDSEAEADQSTTSDWP